MNFTKYVRIRQERFGAVVFETLAEKVYVTNRSGARILAMIGEDKDIDGISETLAASYLRDPRIIKEEVVDFVGVLKEKELLV